MSGTSIFDDSTASAAGSSIFGGGNSAGLVNSMSSNIPSGAQGINLAQQQQAWNQARMAQQHWAQQQHRWMINGRTMNFQDFLDEICPEEDDPMRTFLTLKYKGRE